MPGFEKENPRIEIEVEQFEVTPFCCRCKENFRVSKEPANWAMGELRLLKHAPLWIQKRFHEWLDSEIHGEGYLCGNCYFDFTD